MIRTPAGLEVLLAVAEDPGSDLGTLTDRLGRSRRHLNRVVSALTDAGHLTETSTATGARQFGLGNSTVATRCRELCTQHQHVEWAALLTPHRLDVCWYLDESRRVSAIATSLDCTRQYVSQAVRALKRRGMLAETGPDYRLREEFRPLVAFARAVVRAAHRQAAGEHAPDVMVEWCDPRRALVVPATAAGSDGLADAEEWAVTGLARFADYGLQFHLGGQPSFWRDTTGQPLTAADVCCHSLVRRADSRRLSYALLLIESEDIAPDTLEAAAARYGVEAAVDGLLTAAIEGVDATDLPLSASEYDQLRAQYEVEPAIPRAASPGDGDRKRDGGAAAKLDSEADR